jgi:hypothetical protein
LAKKTLPYSSVGAYCPLGVTTICTSSVLVY